MIDIATISPDQIDDEVVAAWRFIQQTEQEWASPYFHPEFTRAVAAVRSDVEVSLFRDRAGQIVGVFPFQRRPLGVAQPVGGRLSDFHGPLALPEACWTADDWLGACNLQSYGFDHLVEPSGPIRQCADDAGESYYLDLSNGFEAYQEEQRQSGSKQLTQVLRKRRKIEREHRDVRFEWNVDDAAVFDQLLEWKSAQYRRTGLTDVFRFDWTVELLKELMRREGELRGVLSAMWADDRLIAVHFGMQADGVLHYWFPAYDVDFAKYSPGLLLLIEVAKAAREQGVLRIDLGLGDEEYKATLGSDSFNVYQGAADRPSAARWLRRGYDTAKTWVKQSPFAETARSSLGWARGLRDWLAFR